MGIFQVPSPLPPLDNQDTCGTGSLLRSRYFLDSTAVHEGASSAGANRFLEVKSANLMLRPKISLDVPSSSPGFSSTYRCGQQLTPRHDHDVASCSKSEQGSAHGGGGGTNRLNSSRIPIVSRTWSAGRRRLAISASESRISITQSTLQPEARVTVSSNDPEVLKSEIRRLQAALMDEFKGGNRFVGGAQFKASIQKSPSSCGGCLQVREALRRSRVETRDLRDSLIQAESAIKQLALTKVDHVQVATRENPGAMPGSKTEKSWACKKCVGLEERLLAEAIKINGLTQKFKRLQEDLVNMEKERGDAVELRQRVDALAKKLEAERLEKDELAKEKAAKDIETRRLASELNRWMAQALEYDGQVKILSEQYGEFQSKASDATQRLEQIKADFTGLQAVLKAERTLRSRREREVDTLAQTVASDQATMKEMEIKVVIAKEDRRQSESQAAATEVTHRRALKATLNSCVRLCVVAPTVNINLNDYRRSFCSGLPEEKIRTFVESSLLPRFTRVLLQPGSDDPFSLSPMHQQCRATAVAGCGSVGEGDDGGDLGRDRHRKTDFDKWLRDLLIDMQTSIEKHVASVFQAQTSSTEAVTTWQWK